MERVSCAVIVKNAESTLERLLQSVRPHVDELVVVDTGSTDETTEIICRYADVAASFPWCDDFSAARNEAFDLCSGDWVLWLDADDELYEGESIRRLVEEAPPELGAYLCRYVTDVDSNGKILMQFWRERLIRRGWGRWEGRAHEVIVPTKPSSYKRDDRLWVLHHGHNDATGSMARNIRLLELDLQDKPDHPRTLFYLGRDLLTIGALERARAILERYVRLAVWADEKFIAQGLIAHCHRAQGRHQDAYNADLACLAIHPLWPQAYFSLAQDAYFLQRWDWSVHWSEIGQGMPWPDTNLFTAPGQLESGWMIYQVVALYNLGRIDEAAQLSARALELLPEDQQHLQNVRFFTEYYNHQRSLHEAALAEQRRAPVLAGR